MEILERVSSTFAALGSLAPRLDNCVIDLKLATTQSKQQLVSDLLKESDDEGEIMLLAMILLQLNGVKLPEEDDLLLNKKKRQRTSPDQLEILERIFQTDKMPNQQTRVQLADQLGMSSRRVQIWFQNKRAKVKRSSSRPDGECPSPNSLSQSTSSFSSVSSPSSPSTSDGGIDSPVASPESPSPSVVPDTCKASLAPLIISSTSTSQLKAQQLQFSLNHPFAETQPVLTATY